MNSLYKFLLALPACLVVTTSRSQIKSSDSITKRALIVFFDGLRTDYITPEAMPNLYRFKKAGSYGQAHHSVFPTVTRVNSASYSTGTYPAKSGLMGNSVYFPEVNKTGSINTGNAQELIKISEVMQGKLLTSISLGEILQSQGKRMMVFSSGSTGQAFLQNHTISGGAIINPALILPDSLKEVIAREIGPVAPKGNHKWVTDALINYGFAPGGPSVSAIWFSDPDGTAHSDGIGSATAMASIKVVDEQFGRILDTLDNRNLAQSFNIIISTDHGFVTHVGTDKESLTDILVREGLKKDKKSDDVVLAGGAIYVKDHDAGIIRRIVALLHKKESVGAIFTKAARPGDLKGFVEGTLSFDAIHWNHPQRAADILVDVNWDDRKNSAGYAGATYLPGVAGHGSLSPYEVHIPLIVSGPDFKQSFESNLPTSNVDIAPTILHILRIDVPATMDGRVMTELLNSPGKLPVRPAKKQVIQTSAPFDGGTYQLVLERSLYGRYKYVNFAKVKRTVLPSTGSRAKL
jgi:predicted AlkP superfamily pyrophosphatase or phosphodiesterase